MSFLASRRVRAAIGVAMLAAGAPAFWGVWELFEPSFLGPRISVALWLLTLWSGWGVLAAWTWRGARAVRGWRRGVGVAVAAVLALAALSSLLFCVWLAVAGTWEGPLMRGLLGFLCPGLLVGGLWLLSGLAPKRRAQSAGGQG